MKAGIFLECSLFFVPFFSLNDLEGEIAAVRKELKEVEKVNGLFRNIINSYAKLTCFSLWYTGARIPTEKERTHSRRQVCRVDGFICEGFSVFDVRVRRFLERDESKGESHTHNCHSLTWTDTQPDGHSQKASLADCWCAHSVSETVR